MTQRFDLVAIDLDQTLLGPDHQIPEVNQRAVHHLLERGVHVVIASGRMHEATLRYYRQLDLNDPIISYNGAMVRHPETDEIWRHLRVPSNCASEIVRYCAENHHHLNYYLEDQLYVAERGEWAEFYFRQTQSIIHESGDLKQFEGKKPTKLILIDEPRVVAHLLPRFRTRYGDRLYITTTNPEYLEFMNPTASKESALQIVCEHLKITADRTIAFGDSDNDIGMLQWAGLGVAMGNAKSHVLEIADYIAPSYDQNGLAAAIMDIFREDQR